MPVFQHPVAIAPAARPYVRSTYVPPPRVITRYEPGRTVYRDRYVPGPSVTRNVYNTTYVNRGFSPDQQRAFEESARRREYDRLMRDGRWTREQAQAQAAALAAQQAQYAAQQAQQSAIQAQSAYLQPGGQNPSAAVSPGSAAADLSPAQDQAAAADGGGDGGEPAHSSKHLLMMVGLVAAAGVVGYMVLKKKKKSGD